MRDVKVDSFVRESVETIWNQKMLGRILDLYAPHSLIHCGAGRTLHGGRQFLDHAVQCVAVFPDLRVFVDDVICARRAAANLTAVRWTAVARNSGPGAYGLPTGRRVVVTGITASRIERGCYAEQWIEVGDGDLARQLGLDVPTALRRLQQTGAAFDPDLAPDPSFDVQASLGPGTAGRPPESLSDTGPLEGEAGAGETADPGALVAAAVDAVWNRRLIGAAARFYAPGYREWRSDGRTLFGREEMQADVVSLLGAFPDLRMHVDDLFWEDDDDRHGGHGGCRSCLRWTLLGTNTGPSAYGPPTGRGVRLAGLTTHRIEGGRFVEGWTAYSELDLARQLIGATQRAGSTAGWDHVDQDEDDKNEKEGER